MGRNSIIKEKKINKYFNRLFQTHDDAFELFLFQLKTLSIDEVRYYCNVVASRLDHRVILQELDYFYKDPIENHIRITEYIPLDNVPGEISEYMHPENYAIHIANKKFYTEKITQLTKIRDHAFQIKSSKEAHCAEYIILIENEDEELIQNDTENNNFINDSHQHKIEKHTDINASTNNLEDYKNIILDAPSSQVNPEDNLTFKWLEDEKSLRLLYDLLLAKKFIAATDFDNFKLAFSGNNKPAEPLVWLIKHHGEKIRPNKATLFYLLIGLTPEFVDISMLYRNTFISMTHNMFVDFEGKKFDNLKQSKIRFKNRIKEIQEIKYNKPAQIQGIYSDLNEILISLYQQLPENT